jgi:hypothetical protein
MLPACDHMRTKAKPVVLPVRVYSPNAAATGAVLSSLTEQCVWTRTTMPVQTKFLRLREPASLGDRIDDWRVCWLGGWDKCRVFFVVMVERK